MVLESLVAVLDLISAVFRVVACPESDSLVTSAALLLKYVIQVSIYSMYELFCVPLPIGLTKSCVLQYTN